MIEIHILRVIYLFQSFLPGQPNVHLEILFLMPSDNA